MPGFFWYGPQDATTLLGGATTLTANSGTYNIAGNALSFGEFAQWMDMSIAMVDTQDDSAAPTMGLCATYGDYQLIIVETDDVAVTLSTANGFTEHPGSPVSVPNADSTIRTRLTVFERLWNGTDGAPTISAAGSDHIIARSCTFRANHRRRRGWFDLAEARSPTSGTGWAAISEATEDTSGSFGSILTDSPEQLIIGIIATAKPAGGPGQLSAITNANLTAITERVDITLVGGTIGNGGGLGVFTGEFAEQGDRPDPQVDFPIGTTTFTWTTASYKASLIIALRPGSNDETPTLKTNCTGPNDGHLGPQAGYFISGSAATLKVSFLADSGSYVISGTDATLIHGGGGVTLTADSGSYAITGTAADAGDITLPAASGAYAISGTDVTFHDPQRLNGGAGSGVYVYAGASGPDEVQLEGPDGGGPVDNRNWLRERGDTRHWRFFGTYRRSRRTGTIH